MPSKNPNIKLLNPTLSKILQKMKEEGLLEENSQLAEKKLPQTNPEVIKFTMKCESVKQAILDEMDEEKASEEEKNIVKNYFKNLGGF